RALYRTHRVKAARPLAATAERARSVGREASVITIRCALSPPRRRVPRSAERASLQLRHGQSRSAFPTRSGPAAQDAAAATFFLSGAAIRAAAIRRAPAHQQRL